MRPVAASAGVDRRRSCPKSRPRPRRSRACPRRAAHRPRLRLRHPRRRESRGARTLAGGGAVQAQRRRAPHRLWMHHPRRRRREDPARRRRGTGDAMLVRRRTGRPACGTTRAEVPPRCWRMAPAVERRRSGSADAARCGWWSPSCAPLSQRRRRLRLRGRGGARGRLRGRLAWG